MRLIDADAILEKKFEAYDYDPIEVVEVCDIEDAPTIEVEPVKSGYNTTARNPVDDFICSECGVHLEDWLRVEYDEDDDYYSYHEYIMKYCPNCGAKMEGEQK